MRSSAVLILTFVFSSMLTAVLIVKIPNYSGEYSYASKGKKDKSDKSVPIQTSLANQGYSFDQKGNVKKLQDTTETQENLTQAMSNANSKLDSASVASNQQQPCEVCQIESAGHGSEDFAFETENSCREKSKEKRLYFRDEFKMMPTLMTQARKENEVSAEFPRECVTYIMRNLVGVQAAIKGKALKKHKMYAKCTTHEGEPTYYEWPLCITEEYVNSVYYSFTDVFSCFGLSQKGLLPKFFQESGMHINALGPSMDAGLGQLTSQARPKASDVIRLEKMINNGVVSNPACARLQNFIIQLNNKVAEDQTAYNKAINLAQKNKSKKTKVIIPPKPQAKLDLQYFVNNYGQDTRCELVEPPENPFLNIFYMAAKIFDDEKTIDNYFDQSYDIQIEKTISILNKKTKKREKNTTIENQKFNLEQMILYTGLVNENASAMVKKMKEFVHSLAYNIGPKGARDVLVNYFKLKISEHKKMTLEDFNFHVDERKLKKIATSEKKKDADLTFPEFLYRHPSKDKDTGAVIGAPAYLVQIAAKADKLNTVFKEGTCVPSGFLQL